MSPACPSFRSFRSFRFFGSFIRSFRSFRVFFGLPGLRSGVSGPEGASLEAWPVQMLPGAGGLLGREGQLWRCGRHGVELTRTRVTREARREDPHHGNPEHHPGRRVYVPLTNMFSNMVRAMIAVNLPGLF